jgi:myb proto-oncogene protein
MDDQENPVVCQLVESVLGGAIVAVAVAVAEAVAGIAPNDHVRTASGCYRRWSSYVVGRVAQCKDVNRGRFSKEEDYMLQQAVTEFGPDCWREVARKLPNRTTKQCRERWQNCLSPDVKKGKKGPWTAEEDHLLLEKHREYGNRWATIAGSLPGPGRTGMAVKHRYELLQRRQRAQQNNVISGHAMQTRSGRPRAQQNDVIPGTADGPGGDVDFWATLFYQGDLFGPDENDWPSDCF